ncbi:MAG: hydrogen peroxide-inducible genes activator [Odoribacter sp.]|nr:hydrogen peroxide-inducible genes activator [Odoribacter sp.]
MFKLSMCSVMVTLTQLEYIVAVDEYRHFAMAAEKCYVTQPTLSMQIKKLEDELGLIIFDRTRQPIVPTDIGVKLLEQARVILASSSRFSEIITENKSEVEGVLKLGIIPTLSSFLLPMFAGHYTRKYPAVKIEVEELVSEEIVRRLKRETLDAAIFVTPYEDERIIERPVFYEEMMIYAHPDHSLLKKKKIEVSDVMSDDIWMLSDGHCFRDQVVNLCEFKTITRKSLPFEFESNSLDTLIRIVDREGGFTLIPELAIHYLDSEHKKRVRSFSSNVPLREVSVIYSRHYIKHRLVELVCEELKNVVPKHMLDKDRGKLVEWKNKDLI